MKLSSLLDQSMSLEGPDVDVWGISMDSRAIEPGMVFVAIAGSETDGARFVPDVVAKGAAAIVVGEAVAIESGSATLVTTSNPRRALAGMAARLHPRQPDIIAAVTGTAGKTSVASFTRQIWESLGKEAAMIGTTGVVAPGRNTYGALTTPDPVALHALLDELAREGVTHCAMEASSHGLDQDRLSGVRLSVAGFTNLGRDHLDYHSDMEDYLRAKMRLFDERLPEGAPAVIFADDAYSERVIDHTLEAGRQALSVGRNGTFIAVKRVEQQRFSQIAELAHEGRIWRVELPMAGEFQLANALVAAGMVLATGGDAKGVFAALGKLQGAPGRLELVGKTQEGAPCYVDYAHKPEALENVLTALRPYATGRLVVVFGCGGDRDPGKRPIMGEIAARLADDVIVTDDNPRREDPATIRAAIMEAASGAREIGDRRKAIETAVDGLGRGDCLVVAGKGHEEGQIVGATVLPFSDHAVLREKLGLVT